MASRAGLVREKPVCRTEWPEGLVGYGKGRVSRTEPQELAIPEEMSIFAMDYYFQKVIGRSPKLMIKERLPKKRQMLHFFEKMRMMYS